MRWSYLIPVAPVSVNDAYRTTSGYASASPKVYMEQGAEAYKRYLIRDMERQDATRGKPLGDFYRCTWYFIYPEDEYYSDVLPEKARALQPDPTFRDRDVSNGLKLAEDALFQHLGVTDARVVEIRAVKLPVRVLPRPPHAYTTSAFGLSHPQGNIVLVVEPRSVSDLLPEAARILGEIRDVLEGTDFKPLVERDHPTQDVRPAWARVPNLRDRYVGEPLSVFADALAARDADEDGCVQLQSEALRRRLAYWMRCHGYGQADALDCWHRAGKALRQVYRTYERGKITEEQWWTHPAWHAEWLAAECTPTTYKRLLELRRVCALTPTGVSALIVGDPAGTYAQGLHEAFPDWTLTVLDWPAHVARVRDRVPSAQCIVHNPREPFTPNTVTPLYDVILMLDLAQTIRDPRSVIRALSERLSPSGRLFTAWNFQTRKVRQPTPWVCCARVGSFSMSHVLSHWMTERPGLGLRRVALSTSDLTCCVRPS